MRSHPGSIIVLVLILALGGLAPIVVQLPDAVAQETVWPTYRGETSRSGVATSPGPAANPSELWRVQTQGAIRSEPAVVAGVVYIGSDDGNLYAFDATTGDGRWRFTAADAVSSSPAVANDMVYAGSGDGVLHALEAANGEERWSFPGARSDASPAVVDGVVYTGGEDGVLYALDAADGTEIWQAPLGGAASRSVAVNEGLVVVGAADGHVHSVDQATGKERWRFPVADGTISTPVIVDGVVYECAFGGSANALYAIDAATGEERWRFTTETGDSVWVPVVAGDTLYTGSDDGNIYAVDTASGTERWRFATGDRVDSSPTLANGVLYALSHDRNLYAIDAASGHELWHFAIDGGAEKGPTIVDGVAYFGTTFGSAYAVGGTSELQAAGATPAAATTTAPAIVDATPLAAPAATGDAPVKFLWRTTGGPAPLRKASGMAIAPDGNVWISDSGHNQFQIFAPDGTFLETWGEAGTGEGQFDFVSGDSALNGLAFTPDGGFYVADTFNVRIQQFDADRNFLRAWGTRGTGDGQFIEPFGVHVAPNGDVFVVDDQRDDVQIFTPDGQFLRQFGGHGSAEGQLNFTGWGTFDAAGNFWIADWGNSRVQQFAPDGTFLQAFGNNGSAPGEFQEPVAVAIDAAGRVFVTDFGNPRVQVFDSEGNLLAIWTGADAGGTAFGNGTYGIALDDQGHIYVQDNLSEDDDAVHKFRLLPPFAPSNSASMTAPAAAPEATPGAAAAGAASNDVAGLFDIGDRSLYLTCTGAGSPTVLLEVGSDGGADTWALRADLAEATATRVCAYDRANVGRSDPAPLPRTGADVVADLHALLDAADIPGPYVIASASLGGLFTRLYASTHPDDIVGMVLLDPSYEEQDTRTEERFGPELWETLAAEWGTFRDDEGFFPDGFLSDALVAELRETRQSSPLQPMPLIVVTNEIPCDASCFPDGWPVEEDNALWRSMQEEQAALVPGGRLIVSDSNNHYLQEADPELVIAAIVQVVEGVRDPGAWNPSA